MTMKFDLRALALCAGASWLATLSPAAAQGLDTGMGRAFDADRNVSVRERPRPEYDALGLRQGSFLIYPKVALETEYNDNVLATSRKSDDIILRATPEVTVRSNWSRNALVAFARANHDQYRDFSSDNTTDWRVGGRANVEIGRGGLVLGGETGQLTQPRYSTDTPTTAASPIQYHQDVLLAQFGQELNRLRLTGRTDFRKQDFEDGRDFNGGVIPQDFRDHTVTGLSGKAEYAISSDTAVFVSGGFNRRRYDLTPPQVSLNRDSEGFELTGGVNFDITRLVRGEVQLGYLRQEYKEAQFGNISGLAGRGQVEWFPTQLTTVTFTGERSVEESATLTASGYLDTRLTAQVDHELRRNVILTARAGFEDAEYKNIDRRDRFWSGSVAANWLINRRLGLAATYSRLSQESSGAVRRPDFNVNRFIVSLVVQL